MNLFLMAQAVRFLSVDMIEKARSGHPGMPSGMADVATVLWSKFLKFDASAPTWADRDRFVLSNGHGSALLYSLLYLSGYGDISLEDLKNFRQMGSKTAGHPELGLLSGVEFSTGPLGQGLAGAVGFALAEKILNAKYGDLLVNHKTYVFVGDGCLMEGLSEEAISFAGHFGLNKLIVLWDDNQITIDGQTNLTSSVRMKERFEANNWQVLWCDGHDFASIEQALEKAQHASKPTLIDCRTIIGFGAPSKQNSSQSHGSPLGSDEIAGMRENLKWPYAPFDLPAEIRQCWQAVGMRGEGARLVWEDRLARSPDKDLFLNELSGHISEDIFQAFQDFKKELSESQPDLATRKSSQKVLGFWVEKIPQLIGGSADLSSSCLTLTGHSVSLAPGSWDGNYVHYGVREHLMGAVMNGLAVHGGFIPYGGTFLSFSDYLRPALRLSALMHQRVIYVFSHDSIAVGEDGPTHQPIEQLAALRCMPNLNVFRPADSLETAESYETALKEIQTPSAIILSRQVLPTVRQDISENLTARGAYVLFEPEEERHVTLLATGSEVAVALRAKDLLHREGVFAAVVSMPCWRLFEMQKEEYQREVLGTAPRVSIEMASSFGWARWTGEKGLNLSIDRFGESGKGEELIEKYGFSPENVARTIREFLCSLK